MRRLSVLAVSGALLAGCGAATESGSGSTGSGSASGQDSTRSTGASAETGGAQTRGGEGAGLVNGGFEQPQVSSYDFFDEEVAGWTVSQESVEIINESYGQGYRARSGDQVLVLNGYSGAGAVRQAVPTEPGERYRLVFYLTADPDAEGPLTLTASAGSASDSYEVGAGLDSFRRAILVFEGASGSDTTRVGFTSTTEGSDYGPFVDDVSVEPIGGSG